MSNYSLAKKELLLYMKANTPLIVVESSERERVEQMLCEIACEQSLKIEYYTDAKQLCTFGPKAVAPIDINSDPLQYGFEKLKKNKRSIFVIGDITNIENENAFSREFLNLL